MSSLSRQQWQTLARTRLREAEALLAAGEASGAYYFAGFAVECALKACIAKQFEAETWPTKEFIRDIYQHGLWDLAKHARIRVLAEKRVATDRLFGQSWVVLRKWNNEDRYRITNRAEADAMLWSVGDPVSGVLPWIETLW